VTRGVRRAIGEVTLRILAIVAVIFVFLLLVAGHVQAGQNANGAGKTPAVVEALATHERLVAAALTSDAAVFDELLSEDLVVNAPNNRIYHRDDLLSLFTSGEVEYRSVETIIDYADQVGDLVVIMGKEITVLESAPEGSPWGPGATLHRRFTNVYRQEDGEWRLVVKQSTVFSVE
jgi:ketosteroid isomerase-like protein